jgi:predicted RNase H-like HicB family nuclease
MKEIYIYPAIFDYADDGISISFPDLSGCLSCADTDEEAVINAKEALALHLYSMEEDGDIIPEPTPISKIKIEKNQIIVPIEVWMPYHRSQIKTVYVKKTLTIPNWLDSLAKLNNINFSQVLQEALKEKLGVK